ncbi:MAG: GGDEF domain-containing protein, partial [Mariprofundaceae bacterium]|nr:GGDEF domain-containing protein [Mariprofundaceae bacterium]
HLQTLLGEALSQASRYDIPFSVVLLDLDHFKKVNDTHGHPAGDAVLKAVVNALKTCIRDADTIGRWGGEEFLILLPHTGNSEAVKAARQWLKRIKDTPITLPDGQQIHCSFSAGVASYKDHGDKTSSVKRTEALLHAADQRLYQAKNAGRGCICGEN